MISNFLCVPGGPLCEGDIEEADGALKVFCPWHDYGFDLRTGESGTSLQVGNRMHRSSSERLLMIFLIGCMKGGTQNVSSEMTKNMLFETRLPFKGPILYPFSHLCFSA